MPNHRMFSNRIANSAKFLQMPAESQLLYFHMILRADDDGVVESYPLIKMLGLAPDNFKVLTAKGFIRPLNEDQVVVITDWLEHNVIRPDRKVNSIYFNLLKETMPELPLLEPKPRADTGKITGGQPVDVHSPRKLSQAKLSQAKKDSPEKSGVKEVVNYFFELKGWANKEKLFYSANDIRYAHHAKRAKELLELCDGNVNEAKECIRKVSEWASSKNLTWMIETIFKHWYDIDSLKPSEKKPHWDGCRIFQKTEGGKWYIIRAGEIKELGRSLSKSEITWK